jgi:hypothetical protein
MSENKPENRGGYRPGAGRKRIFELGQEKRAEIIRDVQAEAERNGTSFGAELGKLIFGKRAEKRTKLAAMQLYVRDVLPKVGEREVNVNEVIKPQVFLPEKYPDSADAPEYKPPH